MIEGTLYLVAAGLVLVVQVAMLFAFFRLCADVAALRKTSTELDANLAGWLPRLERALKPPSKPAGIACPHCGGALTASGLRAGNNACPHCGETFSVTD